MKAGKLDRSISIEREGPPTDDGFTKKPGAFEPIGTRAAQIIRSRGREVFENQGVEAEVPVTFLVRFDSLTNTITEQDRIGFEGRSFNIKSVNEISRRDGIEIVAVAAA